MVRFYTGSRSSRSTPSSGRWGGTAPRSTTPRPDGPPVDEDAGKFTIDFSKPDLGMGQNLESAGNFLSGAAGGFLGEVGKLGIPGGPNLGDIPEAAGEVLGAFGRIGIPDASYGTNEALGGVLGGGGSLDLGSLPGAALDLISLPGRAVERAVAGGRVAAAQRGERDILADAIAFAGASLIPGMAGITGDTTGRDIISRTPERLPDDLQERLMAGESVDAIADELVARGAGFSSNPVTQLATAITFDPLNLLSAGTAGLARGVQKAGVAVRTTGADVTPMRAAVGHIYNTATHGLTRGQQGVVEKIVGPATSGVFFAIGTKPFRAITSKAGALAPEFAERYQRYFGVGAAQLPRAVIARMMGDEAADAAARGIARADRGEIPDLIEARLQTRQSWDPKEVTRDTEEILLRTTPDFLTYTRDELLSETAAKLALTMDSSVDDALRVIGNPSDAALRSTAQHVNLAYMGRAGDDLAEAKRTVGTADNIDVERLTLISPRTLTDERATNLLSQGDEALRAAVDDFDDLAQRYSGMAFDPTKVREYVEKLQRNNMLPKAVRTPTTGNNALPGALGAWRAKHSVQGYDLGFAPEDGWKVLLDDDTGEVIRATPFVHFVSAQDPLTQRNALGRFMDNLHRGITQTTIVLDSRARFVKFTRDYGISPNQARAIHKNVLNAAADEGVSPRGLALFGHKRFDEAYEAVLGPEGYRALQEKANPTFLLMRAFEGNLSRVGATQKFTGAAKSASSALQPAGGNVAAALADGIYPLARFRYNPLFQAQEKIESPFLNLVRGVAARTVPDDVAKVYSEMTNLPEFKYLTEAGYFLHIAGHGSVERQLTRAGRLGTALKRFTNVSAGKERARIAQVFSEHPEQFRDGINRINPDLWAKMSDAYGTDDAATIADMFIRERFALASGNIDEAMAVVDNARPALEGLDAEIVWQGFRESFRQASLQAFKTHYFNPRRGWLERTINHPYLGIYPISYMWGKVVPEFARFLLKRPFGIDAPLTGMAALGRLQQQVVASMADPEFNKWVGEHEDGLYLLEMLLPGTPQNLPANLPAWARHIAEDAGAGREVTTDTVFRELGDAGRYAFGPRAFETVGKGVLDIGAMTGDVIENLTRAAAEYDGQFSPSR